MEAAGGHNNAYTRKDLTVYQDWFPPQALELIFDLEADRIRDLASTRRSSSRERGVVSQRAPDVGRQRNAGLSQRAALRAPPSPPTPTSGRSSAGWSTSRTGSWTTSSTTSRWATRPERDPWSSPATSTFDEIVRPASVPRADPGARPAAAKVTTKEPAQMGERRVKVKKYAQLPLPHPRLSRPRIGEPGLLRAAGARKSPLLRPELAPVPAPGRPRPTDSVRPRRLRLPSFRPAALRNLGAAEGRGGARGGRTGSFTRSSTG